jgi:hypothetical protein
MGFVRLVMNRWERTLPAHQVHVMGHPLPIASGKVLEPMESF